MVSVFAKEVYLAKSEMPGCGDLFDEHSDTCLRCPQLRKFPG
jgi:hypothetical protein